MDAALRSTLAQKGPNHTPRSRHLGPGGLPRFTNRLIGQSSPYLLQHAHNPVNWFPWGDEALSRAKALGQPVFLSVGYSTCHWCHVMEEESFEDLEIAAYLNAHFVAIKVDREERPDIDSVFMDAVQAMTGRGGWPMTVVLTPSGEPFFGGTYFPPRDGARGARKGLLSILRELEERFRTKPDDVVALAAKVSGAMQRAAQPLPSAALPDITSVDLTAAVLARRFDATHGGFGGAPKFPRPVALELLLRHHVRTHDAQSLEMVVKTLEQMAHGGIHDHVGGGFHRYATDAQWRVPHFEKMLYDNAQLAVTYLEVAQLTGRADMEAVVAGILDYVLREMTDATGGFHSATDADSRSASGEQHEGWFFTWTPQELEAVLGAKDARVAKAWFAVSGPGPVEGRHVLHTPRTAQVVAAELGLAPDALVLQLKAIRTALRAARSKRAPPLLDDKVLAGWNGLMVSALARAGFTMNRPAYLQAAQRAAAFLMASMRMPDGALARAYRHGHVSGRGFLEDHAFVIQAMLDLYGATADVQWLRTAMALQDVQDRLFHDEEHGAYFQSAASPTQILTRPRPYYDGAEPSGNAVSVLNLLRLHEWTAQDGYRQRAETTLGAFGNVLRQSGVAAPLMLCGLDFLLGRPRQVVVVTGGPPSTAGADALRTVMQQTFLPNAVFTVVSDPQAALDAQVIPWLAGKRAQNNVTTAYVCEHGRCEKPTSEPAVLKRLLVQRHP